MPGFVPIVLWDGRNEVCFGYREGLPWWKWDWVPRGLVTRSQLWEQGLRRRRGQEPVGLLIFRKSGCGEQVAELYRIDEAIASRPMSERWQQSIEAMRRAHRTCRGCGQEFDRYLSTKTWRCVACMTASGDFGEPDHHKLTTQGP
jgi:hypothetical protein